MEFARRGTQTHYSAFEQFKFPIKQPIECTDHPDPRFDHDHLRKKGKVPSFA